MWHFFSETTLHGLCHIDKEKPWFLNVLWSLIFLVCSVLTSLCVYNQVQALLDRTTTTEYAIKDSKSIAFPRPAFCSPTKLDGRKLKNLHVSDNLTQALHIGFEYLPSVHYNFVSNMEIVQLLLSTKDEYQSLMESLNATDYLDVIRKLSMKCEDLFEVCLEIAGDHFDCCKDHFTWIYPAGVCYALKLPNQTSPDLGVQILVKLPSPKIKVLSNFALYAENAITVQFWGDEHDPKAARTFLPPGTHVIVNAMKAITHSVNNPGKDKNNPDRYNCVKNDGSIHYNKFACVLKCIAMTVNETCGCVNIESISFLQYVGPVCSPYQRLACGQDQEKRKVLSDMKAIFHKCSDICPQACDQVEFEYTITSAPFDKDLLMYQWDNDVIRVEEMMKHRALFEMLFDSLEYDDIVQSFSITTLSLVSGIGGVMGIGIGASFISCIHILVFCLNHLVFRGCEKREVKCKKQSVIGSFEINPEAAMQGTVTWLKNDCK